MRESFARGRWLVLALLVAGVALRGVHLGADPLATFIPGDTGYQIDEGYKTLSPRNLALFGTTHWNEHDHYPGWMQGSPVTQWAYYASFSLFGVDRVSARLVSAASFALLVLLTVAFFRSRYGAVPTLVGVLLLVTDQALFHFSRVAVFELPLSLFVYGGIFMAALVPREHAYLAPLVLLVVTGIAALGVKFSGLLYLLPPVLALLAVELPRGFRAQLPPPARLVVAAVVGAILVILYLRSSDWHFRLSLLEPLRQPEKLLLHPTYQLSPLAAALAYLALLDICLRSGLRAFLEDRYLLMLGSVVLFVPVILALDSYGPARYYMVIVPAALLLVAEWLHLRQRGLAQACYEFTPSRLAFAAGVVLLLTGSLIGFGSAWVIAAMTFIPQGEQPGLGPSLMLQLYPVVLAALLAVGLVIRRYGDLARVVAAALLVGIVAQVALSAQMIASTLLRPTYTTIAIEQRLVGIVAEDESIAGDWAPYFALDTRLRALYVMQNLNDGERFGILRPTYFLDSGTYWDGLTAAQLQALPFRKDKPILLGEIFGRPIWLVRIHY